MFKKNLFIGLIVIAALSSSCSNEQVGDIESLYNTNEEKLNKFETYQVIDKDEIENPRDKGNG